MLTSKVPHKTIVRIKYLFLKCLVSVQWILVTLFQGMLVQQVK